MVRIQSYDDLNSLFFKVLARKSEERNSAISAAFSKVPYLNSSLFEPTDLEHSTLFISNLTDDRQLPIYGATVLKDQQGRRRTGTLSTLEYLFAFLSAYDFASEGSEEIQEDNKTLINASVLGLIFEKINGYKDGSFFTPGFITMYMCHETIRRAVVQKFNETKGWSCETITDVYNLIDNTDEANQIVNSLKICDPAVGSGHFLVSALNEIIAVKNDLKILQNRDGKRLKEYHVEVENDELIVTDEEGVIFEYNPKSHESQRVQEALFHEKQTIIENCLFGVDINPNSVKICRLRLWIELLKNAYYKNPTELETLPNIDINIKCGNSLISRFAIDADLGQALKKSKWTIDSYRLAVATYRNAENKEQKREMRRLIADIKSDFRSEIARNDPKLKRLQKINGELFGLTNQTSLFEQSKKEKEAWNKKVNKLADEIKKLEAEIEAIKNNKIYEHSFEWRFEFPEVLNEDGDFIGFDVVIENPPYVFARENFSDSIKKYFIENYPTSQYQVNLFFLFIEKTINILKKNGSFSLIIPNSLLMVSSAKSLRKYLLSETSLTEIINLMGYTFEGVNVETIIISGTKTSFSDSDKIEIFSNNGHDFIYEQSKKQGIFKKNEGFELNIFSDKESDLIIQKLNENSEKLDNLVSIKTGLKAYQSGKGKPKQTPEIVKRRPFDYKFKYNESTYKYLEGKDVNRFGITWSGGYLHYGIHLAEPRIYLGKKIIIREITSKYPHSIFATYSEEDFVFNISNIAIVEKAEVNISLKYVLGVLNSKLMSYYFIKNTAKSVRKMFPKLILEDLRKFPFKNCLMEQQQPIIELVNRILVSKKEDINTDTTALESQIDQLVYQLYDLTEEEIKIVEESVS
jgi:tRNA1(Val) A37 N6-methylase TrmN6